MLEDQLRDQVATASPMTKMQGSTAVRPSAVPSRLLRAPLHFWEAALAADSHTHSAASTVSPKAILELPIHFGCERSHPKTKHVSCQTSTIGISNIVDYQTMQDVNPDMASCIPLQGRLHCPVVLHARLSWRSSTCMRWTVAASFIEISSLRTS